MHIIIARFKRILFVIQSEAHIFAVLKEAVDRRRISVAPFELLSDERIRLGKIARSHLARCLLHSHRFVAVDRNHQNAVFHRELKRNAVFQPFNKGFRLRNALGINESVRLLAEFKFSRGNITLGQSIGVRSRRGCSINCPQRIKPRGTGDKPNVRITLFRQKHVRSFFHKRIDFRRFFIFYRRR